MFFLSFVTLADEVDNRAELSQPSVSPSIFGDLPNLTVQSGSFRQERWLKILQEPLVSNGTFVVEKNVSIHWHLVSPFELSYLFDGNHLHLTEDGKVKELDRKSDPLLYGFFAFFYKVFHLSYQELGEWFEIKPLDPISDNKRISLIPKKAFMKKAFTHAVVVEAQGKVENITIFESKGDKLLLQFSYDEKCGKCEK